MVGRIWLPFVFLVDFRQPVVVLFEELSALHVAVWSTAETGRAMSGGWDRNSRPFSDNERTLKMAPLLFWIPLPIQQVCNGCGIINLSSFLLNLLYYCTVILL